MRKVMIVDDSLSMRQMIRFTLQGGGYEVVEATNGQDALDILGDSQMDLLITDLNMPVMDGITLIQRVRAMSSMKGKPILMLTTEGMAEKKAQGREAGATGWIIKPFDPQKLLQTVARVL
jgi:two-component system chemotaxis response regulator CheY